LTKFRQAAKTNQFDTIYNAHFDWWMFLINYGGGHTTEGPNVFILRSWDDVDTLKGIPGWIEQFRESVVLVALSWGWDVLNCNTIDNGRRFGASEGSNQNARIHKMIRSLWLFDQKDLFTSMQQFAYLLLERREIPAKGFVYNGTSQNDCLFFTL